MSDAGGDSSHDPWIKIELRPDPGFELTIDTIDGHEELGRPFLFEVDLSSGQRQIDVSRLVTSTATITLRQSDEEQEDRYLHGVITRAISAGITGGAYRYKIEIHPWIWLLTRQVDCRIFQNKSAFTIITDIFRDEGFTDFRDGRQAAAGDAVLEYCVQYRETSYDFVTRLMEQFGLYYFFEHESEKHTLVFADDGNSHKKLEKALPFTFQQTETRTVADHIWTWTADHALLSGKISFQDYNFKTPGADLTARSVKSSRHLADFEVFDYPGLYDATSDGQRLVDVAMQAIDRRRVVYTGESNARSLRAGRRFTMSKHPDSAANREYLITRSEFSIGIAEATSTEAGETRDTYHVAIDAIAGDVPYRLERTTPRPSIRGPQTAKVVGRQGEEIETDEYGRIKVKFFWDRSSAEDENRTCWIRVAQSWAGAGWGSMFIPRVGQEVVVEFLEGNPDRPLVTGVVYNATMKVPYDLPDNKTISTIKSNSSTGGGGYNELKFDDAKGSEKVYFQAQKDYEKKVLNDEKATVHGKSETTVETGDCTVTVSAGNHTLDISAGSSTVTAAQSITLKVGSSSLKIDPTGVTISAAKISIEATATMSLQGGTAMTVKAGMISLN